MTAKSTPQRPWVGWRCAYCERELVEWTNTHPTKDHVVPVSRGGKKTVWCCYQCNQMKADGMPDEWGAFMRSNPSWWLTGKTFVPKRQEPKSGYAWFNELRAYSRRMGSTQLPWGEDPRDR